MGAWFTYSFVGIVAVTLICFLLGEFKPERRTWWAGWGAVGETLVFGMLVPVFWLFPWQGVEGWIMAFFPVAGAGFAARMAWRRFKGLPA